MRLISAALIFLLIPIGHAQAEPSHYLFFPACEVAAHGVAQSPRSDENLRALYLAALNVKSLQLDQQETIAKNIRYCLAHDMSSEACKPVGDLLQNIPNVATKARVYLALSEPMGSPPPVFERDLYQLNSQLRSAGGAEIERWQPLTQAEEAYAQNLLNLIYQKADAVAHSPETELSQRWRFKAAAVTDLREHFLKEYYEIVNRFPILLRMKQASLSKEELNSLLDETKRGIAKARAVLNQERQLSDQDIRSKTEALFSSQAPFVSRALGQNPQFCGFAEASARRQWMKALAINAGTLGLMLAANFLVPASGIFIIPAALAGSVAYVGYTTRTQILEFRDISRWQIVHLDRGQDFSIETVRDLKNNASSQVNLIATLGVMGFANFGK